MPEGVRPNVEHALQTKGAESSPSPLLCVGVLVVAIVLLLAIGWYRRRWC